MRGIATSIALFGFVAVASANIPPPTALDVRPWIVGTWSFDGTCASGFGVTLKLDGKAGYDEWGTGLWAFDEASTRLVIIAEDISEEADRRQQAELIEFRLTSRGRGNKMSLLRVKDGVKIEAVRCIGR